MHLNEIVNVHYLVMYASANVVYYTAWFSLLCVATKGVKNPLVHPPLDCAWEVSKQQNGGSDHSLGANPEKPGRHHTTLGCE